MRYLNRNDLSAGLVWLAQKAQGSTMSELTHAEKDVLLEQKDATIASQAATIAGHEETIAAHEATIADLNTQVTEKSDPVPDEEYGFAGEHEHKWTKGVGPGNKQLRICTVAGCGKTEETV